MSLYRQIKKSFPYIEKLFDTKSFIRFIQMDYCKLSQYHFSLGLWIRNHLLQDNSQLYRAFRENGIMDKDDMSMLIIQLFYLYIRAKHKARN